MPKGWLERVAEAIPLSVYRRLIRREVVGFFYHAVADEDLPHIRHLYPYKSVAMFQQDLAYLAAHFRPVSYPQYLEYRAGKTRPQTPLALLTFDDGFRECFTVIRPLLKARGIPAIFFVNTDGIDNREMLYRQQVSLCIAEFTNAGETRRQEVVDRLNREAAAGIPGPEAFVRWLKSLNYRDRPLIQAICQALEVDVQGYLQARRPYLSSAEIRTLAAEGFTIGAHTRGHPKLNLLTAAEMEEEIAGSCQVVSEITGQESVPFAFPFSAYGVDREILHGILSRHPVIGLLFDAKGLRKDRRFIQNRIMVDRPLGKGAARSDLPLHLHRAYQDVFLVKVRRRGI